MKKIIGKGILFIIVFIAISLFQVRNSIIRQYAWKQTSGAEIGNGILCFQDFCSYKYQCPLIKRNGAIIAVALFQYKGNLIVFSMEKTALSFFKSI